MAHDSGRGNGMKINMLQYDITMQDLASAMRQDENTIQNKLMQNFHRLTSKANSSCLVNCRTVQYYLRLIIFHYLAYITAKERFTVYFLRLVCTFHVTMEMYGGRTEQTTLVRVD